MPTVAVTLAIMDDNKVLLTKRRDVHFWCLPGGAVEAGETIAEAAEREATEETGLRVELQRLVGIYSRPNWWDGGAHEILILARATGGQLMRETDETVDAAYVAQGNIPTDLLFWHRRRIQDAFEDKPPVLRLQDVGWPFSGSSREQAYELIEQDLIPRDENESFLRGEFDGYVEDLQLGEEDVAP